MLNFVFSPNVLLGFILGSSVIILYFLRLVKPEVARDEDIFFATIGLLYSGILVIHGWRLDPILLFSQVLVITAVLAAGWENIRLRGLIFKMRKKKEKIQVYRCISLLLFVWLVEQCRHNEFTHRVEGFSYKPKYGHDHTQQRVRQPKQRFRDGGYLHQAQSNEYGDRQTPQESHIRYQIGPRPMSCTIL